MNSTGQTFSKTSITNYLKKNEKNYITISIFTEFLQEALFSMKFKCKDLIGKKEVDFFLCEKSGKKIYIQVSFLHCMETIEWDFSPLEKIADNYPICVING